MLKNGAGAGLVYSQILNIYITINTQFFKSKHIY